MVDTASLHYYSKFCNIQMNLCDLKVLNVDVKSFSTSANQSDFVI